MVWSGNGSGTSGDPYLVATASLLNEVRTYQATGVYFKQTADIDLADYQSGNGWVPLSNATTRFKANYDGDGYWIHGVRQIAQQNHSGLFGRIGSGGVVKNVKVYDSQTSSAYIQHGTLCGAVDSAGSVENIRVGKLYGAIDCTVTNTVALADARVGGVTAEVSGQITKAYCRATVSNATYGTVAGISARIEAGTTANLISMADVTIGSSADSTNGGGGVTVLAGTTITDCISYADVNAPNDTGRIGNFATLSGSGVQRCVALGTNTVTTASYTNAAGFSGLTAAAFTDIYWDENINQSLNAGDPGTTPNDESITTAESKLTATYDGMNFSTTWMMLTVSDIESVCGTGYGQAVYDELPSNLQDKPWLRALSDVLIEGITPFENSFYKTYKGNTVIRRIYKGSTEYKIIVQA